MIFDHFFFKFFIFYLLFSFSYLPLYCHRVVLFSPYSVTSSISLMAVLSNAILSLGKLAKIIELAKLGACCLIYSLK